MYKSIYLTHIQLKSEFSFKVCFSATSSVHGYSNFVCGFHKNDIKKNSTRSFQNLSPYTVNVFIRVCVFVYIHIQILNFT